MRRLTWIVLFVLLVTGCVGRSPTPGPASTPIPATELPPTDTTPDPPATMSTAATSTRQPNSTPAMFITAMSATPTVRPLPSPTATDFLLPDLQTLPPYDLIIAVAGQNRKLLRFSNAIVNAGKGKVEIWGMSNAETEKTSVTQRIYKKDGSFEDHFAGEFIFHPDHNHWHTENFALYEVWSVKADGALDKVLAFTDKVSYCLADERRSDLQGAAERSVYNECDKNVQGISVGWTDIYEFDTPGQIVDITDVPSGIYAVQSTVDPANQLRESNDANNAGMVYVEITSTRVRILDKQEAIRRLGAP